jgi:hypothetical protein
MFDNDNTLAQSFNHMIQEKDARHRQELIDMMHTSNMPAAPQPIAPPVDYTQSSDDSITTDTNTSQSDPTLSFNPYPTSIRQSVIQPLSQQQPVKSPLTNTTQTVDEPDATSADTTSADTTQPTSNETTTSEKPLSPDIINLANNTDLSIETIAHEANRIHQKEEQEEVIISLR